MNNTVVTTIIPGSFFALIAAGAPLDYHLLMGAAVGSAAYMMWRPADSDGKAEQIPAWRLLLVGAMSFGVGVASGSEVVDLFNDIHIHIGLLFASMLSSATVMNLAHILVRNTSNIEALKDMIFRRNGKNDGKNDGKNGGGEP